MIPLEKIRHLRELLANAPRWPSVLEEVDRGVVLCPACDGEGRVDAPLDGQCATPPGELALCGVQLYGIGDGHVALSDLIREALSALPALLDEVEQFRETRLLEKP